MQIAANIPDRVQRRLNGLSIPERANNRLRDRSQHEYQTDRRLVSNYMYRNSITL